MQKHTKNEDEDKMKDNKTKASVDKWLIEK